MANKPAALFLCLATAAGALAQAAQPAAAPAAPAPLALDALAPPLPLPDKGQYALQAGMFGSAEAAAALAARLKARKLPVQDVIAVVDQDGAPWYVVGVGAYASPAQAIDAGRRFGAALREGEIQRVIMLPAQAAKQ
jgi:septal ring-binding cell division protein DamX